MSDWRTEGRWMSLDGGAHQSMWERNAADTRYKQQEAIKSELKRQNDLIEKQNRLLESKQKYEDTGDYYPSTFGFKPRWFHIIMMILDILITVFFAQWVIADIGYRIPFAIGFVIIAPLVFAYHFGNCGIYVKLL